MDMHGKRFMDTISRSTSRLELWENFLTEADARTAVEVGVWKGQFAKHILTQCKNIEKYYMIDPWATLPDWNKPYNVDPRRFDDIFSEAMNNTEFASDKIIVLRGRTKEVIDRIEDESLDFAYIDGDHTLRGITIDLIKLFPKIKKGGFIAGDDFTPNPWQHDIRFEPTLVCPYSIYFAEAMDLPIIALPFNQFLIKKDFRSEFSFSDTMGKYVDVSLNKLPIQKPSLPKTLAKKLIEKINTKNRKTTD